MTRGYAVETENSYLIIVIVLAVITAVSWVWLAVIKWQEKRTWHTWGCLIFGLSYLILVCVNSMSLSGLSKMPVTMVILIYAVHLLQLGASISFIFNSYTRDHQIK